MIFSKKIVSYLSNRDNCDKTRERHLITVGFLKALKDNFEHEKAFEIATESFGNYMTLYYNNILSSTMEGSQERFDKFRKHYTEYAKNSDYIQVIKSSSNVLKIQYNRCPFSEIMAEYDLSDLAYAFCLSDYIFTQKLLPNVKLQRDNVIIKGDKYCDHTWIFPYKEDSK
jgi:hypothetical protein